MNEANFAPPARNASLQIQIRQLRRTPAVWRWKRWTRWPLSKPVVAIAAATVLVDVGTAWLDVSMGALGRVPLSPALPLAVALAFLIGWRRLGLDRPNRSAWREFLLSGVVALIGSLVAYAATVRGGREATGLVVAALGEELVYRLAVLVVVGALVAALMGRNWRNAEDWGAAPGYVGLLAAGLVFTFLPGHVAQMSNTLHALPFASLGMVLGYAVLRTGALIPAAVAHAFLNLTTIASLSNGGSPVLRTGLAATALVALVAGTVVAGWRLGILDRAPCEIDLREPPQAPSPASSVRSPRGAA